MSKPRPLVRAGTTPSPDGISIVDRQLHIGGEPFLVLGGELHNSSATSPADLERRWPRLTALGLNTALVPLYWELIEPEEGHFDFSTVDAVLAGAREHGLRVIPLWFGSWKNGLSSYRPRWVKRDPERFSLVQDPDGSPVQVLSAFCEAGREADARALAAVMAHIRDNDAREKTVIMVQVENEVGILGPSRDHSEAALAAWNSPVDARVLEGLRNRDLERRPVIDEGLLRATDSATWPEVFGRSEQADELFQAFGYACYVDRVIERARAEYELPYFVNTWLDSEEEAGSANASGGQRPGVYPSGGPLPHVAAAWLSCAPHLTMLTPDIYRGDFATWCRRYAESNVALFIPEMKKDDDGVGALHVAIGSFGALGTSPFGIDGDEADGPAADRERLAGAYGALQTISGAILAAQRRREIVGFQLTAERPEIEAEFGGYRLRIRRDLDDGRHADFQAAYGIVLSDGDGGFIGTGNGFSVTFEGARDGSKKVALERVEAGLFTDGVWALEQILNGDETISGEFWRFPFFEPAAGASFGEAFPRPRILRAWVYEY